MTKRFIFRMTYYKNIKAYVRDGFIRSKNYRPLQTGYQTSYADIVHRRGNDGFETPCGGVVNDYIPFYFSPITAMAYTIHAGNVKLTAPNGDDNGIANIDDIAFIVCDPQKISESDLDFLFTNIACNSGIHPDYGDDLKQLEEHVNWQLFDEAPKTALIDEIGYNGVCKFFNDSERNAACHNRKKQRMAEFLVKDSFPVNLAECIILKHDNHKAKVEKWIEDAGLQIPVFVKRNCYF